MIELMIEIIPVLTELDSDKRMNGMSIKLKIDAIINEYSSSLSSIFARLDFGKSIF